VCAIVSAFRRKMPLELIPWSVILPFATETETPSGAIVGLISSAMAEPIIVSRSLSASAERTVTGPRNLGLSASWTIMLMQAAIDNRSVLSTM